MSAKKFDLGDLKKVKVPKKKKARPAPEPKPETAPPVQADDEESLFARAMQGVDPMDGESGRQVDARPEPAPAPEPADPEAEGRRTMEAFMRGEIEFELEFTEEYMHGFVRGLDSRDFQKLKNGALSCEAHLDLHGMSADQAFDALIFFLRESFLQGKRCVLLVTGRGLGSPGGVGLLKREVQRWLTRDPLKRIVLAFCTALPRHGGAGALYVLLRKKRKTEGKVQWDRLPGWTPR